MDLYTYFGRSSNLVSGAEIVGPNHGNPRVITE